MSEGHSRCSGRCGALSRAVANRRLGMPRILTPNLRERGLDGRLGAQRHGGKMPLVEARAHVREMAARRDGPSFSIRRQMPTVAKPTSASVQLARPSSNQQPRYRSLRFYTAIGVIARGLVRFFHRQRPNHRLTDSGKPPAGPAPLLLFREMLGLNNLMAQLQADEDLVARSARRHPRACWLT